jgi:hypothetical protein
MSSQTALALLHRARRLVVVGAVAGALAAAGTAGAQPVHPVKKKQSCGIPTQYGTIWVEDGATIVDEFGRTMKCDDGQWLQIPKQLRA